MIRRFAFSLAAMAAITLLVLPAGRSAHADDAPAGSAPAAGPSPGDKAAADESLGAVYPLAILPFTERGKEVADQGGKCTDVLFAYLAANPEIYLVEREELEKLFKEMKLSAAGMTDPAQSTKVGQLTGAKILITGSVFQVGNSVYVMARLIGTETGRALGASAQGKVTDELDSLVDALAKQVVDVLKKNGKLLVPKPTTPEDRMAKLVEAIGKMPRPSVYIDVTERHIGAPPIDPAVETELAKICDKLGFKVIDRLQGNKADADVLLVGSGFSQFATRHADFTSVRARVELKALDRETGRVLASDRQTSVATDLAEMIAAKSALQDATDNIASRLLPEMLQPKADLPAKDKAAK